MEAFGEFQKDIEGIYEIVKPLIKISLDFYSQLDQTKMAEKADGSVVTICDVALQSLIMAGVRE